MKDAVTLASQAFLTVAPGVKAEQDAARLKARMQLPEHTRQRLAGNVKQHGVGGHAVEARAIATSRAAPFRPVG